MSIDLKKRDSFAERHIAPEPSELEAMLKRVGADSLEALISQTIPKDIRLEKELELPDAVSEYEFINNFRSKLSQNQVFKSFIGMGYYGCITPPVIQRNILENPGWYTAYTPYQAEIAQGRLEALVNFQTMVMDLTGMEIANASLLDEGTAAAEAMSMLFHARKRDKKKANICVVDENIFPQTLDILKTRATPLEIEVRVQSLADFDAGNADVFGILFQYPDSNGQVVNWSQIINNAKSNNIAVAAITDLLSLTLLTPPGEMGADVVVGSSQRFGVPMGFGGPHAAFFATKEEYKRQVPGRIIGVSVDVANNKAYRMALQTREQHIKRERATSNICTAQVLLAVMAGMYGVYHGPEGLRIIAERTHGLAKLFSNLISELGYTQTNPQFFDTLKIETGDKEASIQTLTHDAGINLRHFGDGSVGVSFDETHTEADMVKLVEIFAEAAKKNFDAETIGQLAGSLNVEFPDGLQRTSAYMEHEVFHVHRSEHEMLRYMKKLENKDLSLVHSMISLGSCTMKLNATTEMLPVTWPELANIHPFAPKEQTKGYLDLFDDLEKWLAEITGFAGVTLQPNSGAQGEFTGLMLIKAYLESKGEGHRNITLIPSSAHGTNPASAVMAGTKVVIVQCDEKGNIDVEDLKAKAEQHSDNLAALMITYPSTHGVFEERIIEICQIIHDHGGQIYMDGANMNAQVGLTSPARIGADVCHLNLHKTFCIPHGGGGPGVGPVAMAEHLVPYMPGNPVVQMGGSDKIKAIAAAPWGSASILAISYAYIAMMGASGLKRATQIAILNANYIKERLDEHYEILYTGLNNRCAHELIIDCRPFKKADVEVEDIAKRLMDYGFHAPTVSFPVPGTMMIEPTESESQVEIDRFCDALINIRAEIQEIEDGIADSKNNVLKNAPHIQADLVADTWKYPYSRSKAAYPLPFVMENKFWPSVKRIDAAYGDRNLFCACIPVASYSESEEATLVE